MEKNKKYYKYRKFAEENKGKYLDTLKKLITIPAPSYKEKKIAEFIQEFLLKSVRKYHYQNVRIYIDDIFNVYCEINKEQGVEQSIEKGVEQDIEKGIEQDIEKGIEQDIEKGVEQSIEKDVEQDIEKGVEQSIEKSIEQNVEKDAGTGAQVTVDMDRETDINLSADTPYYIIMAHTDTVFSDEEGIVYQEREGRLYGLGAKDNRANICALLYCGEYIFKNQIMPKENLLFVFDVCEEGAGNLRGCKRVFERYKNISAMLAFDLDYTTIFCRAVGSVRYKIKVKTGGGHSFNDFGSANAIVIMSEIIRKFYEIDVNSFEGKTTLNVGKIFGGTTVNAIADQCEALVEWRSDSEKTLREIETIFEKILAENEAISTRDDSSGSKNNSIKNNMNGKDVKITKELIGRRPSNKGFDEDAEKLQREFIAYIKGAAEEISGINVVLSSGSTDCNVPLSMGIPAVCIGTCLGGGEHTREEYVEINSLEKGLTIALAVLDNWILGA